MSLTDYDAVIARKARRIADAGFEPKPLNEHLFDWQKLITSWAIRKGRGALFESCGLGKTLQQLEWARQVCECTGRSVLILTPLAVAAQTELESQRFGIDAKHVRESVDWIEGGVNVTNYDRMHKFAERVPSLAGVVLDESSCIKSFTGKLRNQLTDLFSGTPYRLSCTATPAPNDFTELGQQAEFLGVCSAQEMLATWFINDTADTGTWRLKGHAEEDFWRWVASWAVCITAPSDLGFTDGDFKLPELNIVPVWVEVDHAQDRGDWLIRMPESSACGVHKEQRLTSASRASKVAAIIGDSDEPWLIGCSTNYEADALTDMIPGVVEIRGSDSAEKKEDRLLAFVNGDVKRLLSKASMVGYGLNLQFCRNIIYYPTYSFEDFYQFIRRCWRFGQKRTVNCYLVLPVTLGGILDAINKKMSAHEKMTEMVRFSADALINREAMTMKNTKIETKSGDGWTMHHGDCVRAAERMKDESIDFAVFSPPFSDLFVYSADAQDMGNNAKMDDFLEQFGFIVRHLFRLTKPGRLCAIHCADLMAQKWKDGRIELKNFSGKIIDVFADHDWLYHCRITIWKDPVVEMQRTKALGLLHKQLLKDSTMSRVGSPEYVLVFRKTGDNAEPVTHDREDYPVEQWQKDASPVWMDIEQGEVLNRDGAREQQDERHICPLQLGVIRRLLRLYTNEGDTVFSPFAGIGSEGYCAVKMK